MELKEDFKRLNSETGEPFEQGFVDENGRVFYRTFPIGKKRKKTGRWKGT